MLKIKSFLSKFTFSKRVKLTLIASVMFLIAFIINIPFSNIFNIYKNKILQNVPCNITVARQTFSFFFPKISLYKANIPPNCLGLTTGLTFQNIQISFSGFSFIPMGIKLKLLIIDKKISSQIDLLVSTTSINIILNNTSLHGSLINKLANISEFSRGTLRVKALVNMKNKLIKHGQIDISSQNFILNSSNIAGITIPLMPINKVIFNAKIKSKSIFKINNLTIGDKKSPLILKLKGNIVINKYKFAYSKLNLIGEVKFSESFLNKLSIINLFLSGKSKNNGFYKLKISGTISSPNPAIL